VNRFIKIFTLLIISLFVVVSGVDAALDHLSRSPVQSMFTVYNQQGSIVLAYNGDLSGCKSSFGSWSFTGRYDRVVLPPFPPEST
jgi:hypothetical protein